MYFLISYASVNAKYLKYNCIIELNSIHSWSLEYLKKIKIK